MNLSFAIAKRIAFNQQPSFSRFIIRLSIAATALSVAAMIVTMAFVNGFQQTVSNKIFSFWGHIRVQHLQLDKSLIAEETPILKNDTVFQMLQHNPGIKHVQSFATKSAVIEKNGNIEGILFKGVDQLFDKQQLTPFLQQGSFIAFQDSGYSKQIIVSEPMSQSLKINVGDTVNIYFIESNTGAPSAKRKLLVKGIYKTGIEEYDKLFAIGDIQLIQRLNNWSPQQIGGYEIFIHQTAQLDSINSQLYQQLPTEWASRTMKEIMPNIFDWLNIQNVNKNIIFIVMAFVAIINLITCLLILVLERTKMIGILKSFGATNHSIQQIFIYYATFIAVTGIFIGCVIGLGFYFLQLSTHFITLDETSYYIPFAPVSITLWQVVTICIATGLVCILSLILPTLFIRKISIVASIAFK